MESTNTQIDLTRFVFNDEHDVPKNWNKRAVFGKMQSLHNVLEEYLSIYHAKALAHQYGEHHETNNVDLELKKHVLEFTMEQLSSDRLTQYVQTMQHPRKWHGTIFAVVLHWYDQIKLYMWLKLIGHLPTYSLCLLQKVVEDVIALEYMKECEYMENTHSDKNPLTYLFDFNTTEAICCTCTKEGSEGEHPCEIYIFDTFDHGGNINLLVNAHHCDPLVEDERNKFIWRQKEPLIAEWNYRSCNPKPVDTPRAVHDVGDLGPRDFNGSSGSHKHPVSDFGNNDGDVLRNLGRAIPHLGMAWKQSSDMLMSSIDDNKRWCLDGSRHVGSENVGMTSKLTTTHSYSSFNTTCTRPCETTSKSFSTWRGDNTIYFKIFLQIDSERNGFGSKCQKIF
jgi:hypothetical protein